LSIFDYNTLFKLLPLTFKLTIKRQHWQQQKQQEQDEEFDILDYSSDEELEAAVKNQ